MVYRTPLGCLPADPSPRVLFEASRIPQRTGGEGRKSKQDCRRDHPPRHSHAAPTATSGGVAPTCPKPRRTPSPTGPATFQTARHPFSDRPRMVSNRATRLRHPAGSRSEYGKAGALTGLVAVWEAATRPGTGLCVVWVGWRPTWPECPEQVLGPARARSCFGHERRRFARRRARDQTEGGRCPRPGWQARRWLPRHS